MNGFKSINQIKFDFGSFHDQWIVLYGSRIREDYIPSRSDIDIAFISRGSNKDKNLQLWQDLLGEIPPVYDIRIFELLPLHIQVDIFNQHCVIFGNPLEISEYFYSYYKRWKDMVPRIKRNQFTSPYEKRSGMERRLNLKGFL
jgi:hypothetical protein